MYKKIIHLGKFITIALLLIVLGFIALLLRILSLGYLTNFNRKYTVPFFTQLIMFSIGVKLANKVTGRWENKPQFFTFNHNSIIDAFALMQLGLTNTRFLISEGAVLKRPFSLFMSMSIGALFIPEKKHRQRRRQFFFKTEELIRHTGTSIAGSSEGVHQHIHGIAPFNRGVYHMALLCRMPVVALYIHLPEKNNPFNDGRTFESGTITVETLGVFPTEDWTLETLDEHIELIRQKYIEHFEKHEILDQQ